MTSISKLNVVITWHFTLSISNSRIAKTSVIIAFDFVTELLNCQSYTGFVCWKRIVRLDGRWFCCLFVVSSFRNDDGNQNHENKELSSKRLELLFNFFFFCFFLCTLTFILVDCKSLLRHSKDNWQSIRCWLLWYIYCELRPSSQIENGWANSIYQPHSTMWENNWQWQKP